MNPISSSETELTLASSDWELVIDQCLFLKRLVITKATNVVVSNCPSLVEIICCGAGIKSLLLRRLPHLVVLNCQDNSIQNLDFRETPLLTIANFTNNRLKFWPKGIRSLKYLSALHYGKNLFNFTDSDERWIVWRFETKESRKGEDLFSGRYEELYRLSLEMSKVLLPQSDWKRTIPQLRKYCEKREIIPCLDVPFETIVDSVWNVSNQEEKERIVTLMEEFPRLSPSEKALRVVEIVRDKYSLS